MPTLLKRTDIATFLKIDSTFKLVGNRQTSGSITYDAEEENETYIVDDNATTTISKYTISMDNEMKCYYGDAVYDYVDSIRRELKVGSDCETEVLIVEKYNTSGSAFVAQKFSCSVSVSQFGGDGGATPTISYKINFNGDPVHGTATITSGTATFTPTSA